MKNNLSVAVFARSKGFISRLAAKLRATAASDLFRKIADTFATRIALLFITSVTGVVVTRLLGPQGRGQYAVAVAISTLIMQFGNLGLQTSNTYSVAQDHSLLPILLGNSLVVSLLLGGGGAAAAGAVLYFRPGLEDIHGILLAAALISVPLGLAQMLLANLLIGLQRIRVYNRIEIVVNVLGTGIIVGLFAAKWITVESVFISGTVATTTGLIIILWNLHGCMPGRLSLSLKLFREHLQYGMKVYLATLFGYSLLRIDVLMVQHIKGTVETGFYSTASTMADMLSLTPTVIGTVLFPKLCATKSLQERWSLTRKITGLVCITMLAMCVIASILVRPAVRLFLGAIFLPVIPPFLILAVGMISYGSNTIVSNFLASVGFPWLSVHIWLAAMLLNIVANMVLIPMYGGVGAAIASLLCYTLVFVVQYAYATHFMGQQE